MTMRDEYPDVTPIVPTPAPTRADDLEQLEQRFPGHRAETLASFGLTVADADAPGYTPPAHRCGDHDRPLSQLGGYTVWVCPLDGRALVD